MILKQKVNLFLRLSIAVIILGILFKILHYSYSVVLFIVGAIGIIIFYSLRFSQKQPKKLLDYSKLFLVVAFIIHYVLRVFHWSFGNFFLRLVQIALAIFIILNIRQVLFLKQEGDENSTPVSKSNSIKNAKIIFFMAFQQ